MMPKQINTGPRITREKKTIRAMIRLYCRYNHGGDQFCQECEALVNYAEQRLEYCRFGEQKSTCGNCKVHCYRPKERAQIRDVMRFSGPRMILHHPLMAIQHIFDSQIKPK